MATSIPPHNLGEITEAVCHLIDHPEADVEDLLNFVHGPDFPTGGQVYDHAALEEAYATGRGSVVVRATTNIEEKKTGTFSIIVTEIPYQTNKAEIITRIATLVKDKKIIGIRDIRDESGREEDLRIVIELKKDAYPKKVLNRLFQLTDLQTSFHFNMLALVDGLQPRVLSLKGLLEQYVGHRTEVVTRRTQFELKQAKERAHILAGLKKALDHIDAVIKTIKSSATKDVAHTKLREKFQLSGKQATAILEMKLQTLAGLERKKIEDELAAKKKLIAELESILKSKKKILAIIKKEINELKTKFGDERRTKIFSQKVGEFAEEDVVPNVETVITITRSGYVKRLSTNVYKAQGRGGKGVRGMATKEEDVVDFVAWTMTHNDILFFTTQGRVFQTKVYEIPEASRQAKGQAIVNFLQLAPEEKVTALVSLQPQSPAKYLTMVTQQGIGKRVALEAFASVRRSGLIAIKLKKKDVLRWVAPTDGQAEIFIATAAGQAIRFKEKDVRPMGRNAAGVRVIRLKSADSVIGMNSLPSASKTAQVLTISEHGFGKRSNLNEYKVQRRGGSGIKTAKVTTKTGPLVSLDIVHQEDLNYDLLAISKSGQVIRTPLKTISELGRATQGVRVMRLQPGDKIASVTVI
jgi:DNA gyrase subunit A